MSQKRALNKAVKEVTQKKTHTHAKSNEKNGSKAQKNLFMFQFEPFLKRITLSSCVCLRERERKRKRQPEWEYVYLR